MEPTSTSTCAPKPTVPVAPTATLTSFDACLTPSGDRLVARLRSPTHQVRGPRLASWGVVAESLRLFLVEVGRD